MKDIRLKLLSELMKNSKTSDRELAVRLGVSQPTVSRIRAKLEKEGLINEYTLIPDFRRLGFEIMSVTLLKLKKELTEEEIQKMWKFADEYTRKKNPFAFLMIAGGRGLGYSRVIVSLHRDYGDFVRFVRATRDAPLVDLGAFDSFMISLSEKHYQPFTFSIIADYLLTMKEKTTD